MSATSRGPAVWRRPLAGLSAAGLLAALALVPADSLRGFQPPPDSAITFHDGLTYYGKVRREGEVVVDQFSGESFHATAASSAFILDDGPHYLFFGAKQVRDAREEPDPRKDFVSLRRETARPYGKPLPKNGVFDGETKFVNGRRKVFIRTPEGRYGIDQVMTNLNPFYVRLDAPY